MIQVWRLILSLGHTKPKRSDCEKCYDSWFSCVFVNDLLTECLTHWIHWCHIFCLHVHHPSLQSQWQHLRFRQVKLCFVGLLIILFWVYCWRLVWLSGQVPESDNKRDSAVKILKKDADVIQGTGKRSLNPLWLYSCAQVSPALSDYVPQYVDTCLYNLFCHSSSFLSKCPC